MKLSVFCPFGLKTLIHAPKLRFWRYFTPKMGAISTKPQKCTSEGRIGSRDVLTVHTQQFLRNCVEKRFDKEEELRHIFGRFGITVKWPWHVCVQLFLYLYVHTVEYSTLMSTFDQFRFSFVFLGLPKIGPNRYTWVLPVASLLVLGYDATASSNDLSIKSMCDCVWDNFVSIYGISVISNACN